MIQRIFHPIGQGAFYSERHGNINIVYDCGNWRNTKLADKVVKQSFNKDEEIDILFISHFDYDHVSKIPTLKRHVKKIKRVVLPLLDEKEKILLTTFYRALGGNILTLINDPQRFFGEETKIVYVKPPDNDKNSTNDNLEPKDIDEITKNEHTKRFEVESGTKIKLKSLLNWVFIPYNYNYFQNRSDLINELKKEKLDIDTTKLTIDPKYTLNKIIEDISLFKSKGGKKLREIYDRLSGKINQNSMFLYSGPLQNNQYHKHCFINDTYKYFYPRLYYCDSFNKVGCIYTGDGDLNVSDVKSIYQNYWENVGTIQIPHHGDLKSFKEDFLKEGEYCCPISFGKNNSYGHPSSNVIAAILSNRSYPILITEELDSIYIEIIENNNIIIDIDKVLANVYKALDELIDVYKTLNIYKIITEL